MAQTINSETVSTLDSGDNTPNNWMGRGVVLNWEIIIYVVIFLLAIFSRFYMLGDRVMSHDESLHTVFSHNLYKDGIYRHNPMMHGPILFHVTAASYALFGVDDFTSRIYPALLGVLMVMFPLLMRRWLGRTGAVLTAIMLLLSPLLLYYSRYIRHDIPSIMAAMVMVYAILMYLSGPQNQRRRAHWLYVLAAAMLWNLGSKETAFIYIAIIGLFLTIYWIVRMVQHGYNVRGKLVFDTLMMGILSAGVAALAMIVVFSVALGSRPTLAGRLEFLGDQFGYLVRAQPISADFSTFLSWSGLTLVVMLVIIIGSALWAYRREGVGFKPLDALVGTLALIVFLVINSLLATTQYTNALGDQMTISTAAIGLALGFIFALSICLIYAAFRLPGLRTFRRQLVTVLLIVLVVSAALIVIEELSHVTPRAEVTAAPPVPGEEGDVAVTATDFTVAPLVLVWVIGLVVIAGVVFTKMRGYWDFLDNFPEFDVLMVMGSLILPWLTAVFIVATRGSPADFADIGQSVIGLGSVLPITGAEQVGQFVVGFLAWLPMMAIAVAAGLAWNWRRWIVAAGVFHLLFAFFFTTVLTNIEGLASGMVYSLQYWLEQQGVRRGNQPQYYYLLIIMPLYEFLPVIGGFLSMIAGSVLFWRRRRAYDETRLALAAVEDEATVTGDVDSEDTPLEKAKHDELPRPTLDDSRWRLTEVPFLWFIAWLAVLNLIGYTLAGEKMPWLGTHLTLPLILLSGWYFGRVIERIQPQRLWQGGWLYLLLLPLLIVALGRLVLPLLGGQGPFQGTMQVQLEWTYNWLAMALVAGGVGYVVYRMAARTGWPLVRQVTALVVFVLLGAFTFRAAWAASYINYDLATEFLVYAHGGPGNKDVTDDLRDLSIRLTGDMSVRVFYDHKFSWPGSWYLRDFTNATFIGSNPPSIQQVDEAVAFIVGAESRPRVEPLLEDRFQRFDSVRMWWPMQDYFGLTAQRINDLFSPTDVRAAATRQGILDIWWARDYTEYERAMNMGIAEGAARRSYSLARWPVRETLHFYVRRDIAAQVWPYGIGGAQVLNPFIEVDENLCTANWQPMQASLVIDSSAQPLLRPLGLSVSADGQLFIADEAAHRISIFDTETGDFLDAFGQQGPRESEGAFFERPHSVAVTADGDIFVVDTWNYRVRSFTSDFSPIASWGQPLTRGFDAAQTPLDGFWGPRDIVIDQLGRVYVADTGNKRVRVYDSDGSYLRDIGSGGSGDGQLNEPAGLAIDPTGMLFVADTWNRRVAAFGLDGDFLFNFSVRAWFEELGNRPYLAVDSERNLLYVTDPDAGRVLVYDTAGNCVGSFGQFNDTNPGPGQFSLLGGIALDEQGRVFVSDLGSGRVLRFEPFSAPGMIPEQPMPPVDEINGDEPEITPELLPEEDSESEDDEEAASG